MELLNVCIYLRKSRADREAEARGEGETLARHERILLDLAKKRGYNVGTIYKEIVSGETISARPVMQQLLREVESGIWDGVLVVEVERLARGDTIDQGVVARSFQYSNTLIITPLKLTIQTTNTTKSILNSDFLCPGVNTKPFAAVSLQVANLPQKKENIAAVSRLMDIPV